MLLNNFKVSGFKVFGSTVEINMVPQTKNLRSLEENLIINGQKKHIKSSLLYGGNNTGNSSLLDAFKIFKMIVSKGNIDHFPFDILKNFTYGAQNIEFEVSFFDEKKTYTYGIEFNETGSLGEYIFVEEELFLSRERDGFIEGILVENNLKLKNRIEELQKDKLIVTFINEYVVNPETDVFRKIKIFFDKLVFLDDVEKNVIMNSDIMAFISDKNKMSILNKLLESTEVHVAKRTLEDESYVLNNEHYLRHLDKNQIDRLKGAKLLDALRMVSYYPSESGNLVAKPSILFDSIGTNKFIVMSMYVINAILNRQILFIDEIDNSLHYKITRALIILMNSNLNNGAQFIMTTHDVKLLSQQLLRKDQINFVIRNEEKVTIVSLDDFKANSFKDIRSDSNFE